MLISFVIPCYRSANTIEGVIGTIRETVALHPEFDSEIVLVNDASPDNTWEVIEGLTRRYDNITAVDLAKNSGQQAAILAGLRYSKGDLVAVSDDDGQTPVEEVFTFYDLMQDKNYDVVCAAYEERGHRSAFRKLGSWANNLMVKLFLDKPDDIRLSVFFLAKRFVVDEMIRYDNAFPHIEGLLIRTTFNIGNVTVEQRDRAAGSSGYNFRKLLSTWVNGLTTFSIKPLRISVILGLVMAMIGFLSIIVLVINKLVRTDMAIGWTSMIAVTILIGGMILFMLGIIGEYIGRIYLSLNHNPQYVVRRTIEKTAPGQAASREAASRDDRSVPEEQERDRR